MISKSNGFYYFNILLFRFSQLELKQCVDSLSEELKKISEAQKNSVDLDIYIKKLINAKHRITVVTNVLQTAQDRLNKVHLSLEKETVKRKVLLDTIKGEQQSISSTK